LVKPIISAGAADSVFAENTAPSTSQPFGLSSFTFNGTKYSRLVLASYEALMNSELPLQGVILDELLASIATTFTTALTTAMYTALSGATAPVGGGNPLLVGTDSDDVYSSMTGLRNAIPPRFDLPTNKWMLSRASLAVIRNARASTSGVPMFDPNSNLIFGREFVINDNFDSICGPGFVAFGDWADGMWIRKTPLFTRVFLELYAQSGQVGYRTTQYLDQHFLAELTATAQPPTFQPLYYTVLASAGTS
jgi:HK97 family phage major capsid protein